MKIRDKLYGWIHVSVGTMDKIIGGLIGLMVFLIIFGTISA